MKFAQKANQWWASTFHKAMGNLKSYYSKILTNFPMQEMHIQIVIWNPKLSMIDASFGDEEKDSKK